MEFPLTVIKVRIGLEIKAEEGREILTVVSLSQKVTAKSLAEKAGMKFGDIVVRINDTPASNLTHLEAHNVLLMAGNNFMLGVKRLVEVIVFY